MNKSRDGNHKKDIVEVVRCKDCVSYGMHSNSGNPISYDCYTNMPDDFYSHGIKREDAVKEEMG